MDLNLAGKTVIITGGSKGIGLACAEAFVAEGASVHLVARDPDTLAKAKAEVLAKHPAATVATHALDLSDSSNIAALTETTGAVDVLVNNAGAIPAGTLDAVDEARWREAWDLKVFGYINMTRAYYALMKAAGGGVILNVVGLAAVKLDPGYIAGSTGNASLNAFTKAMGAKALDDGMRVLGVNPGPVMTDRIVTLFKTKAKAEKGSEERWQDYLANLPLGRAAHPHEIADVVTFLASDRAAWVTGVMIDLDGGQTFR
jgi:3-oxoacyl-[acyl-carrier protein] reductase